jgi:hypothetical protein
MKTLAAILLVCVCCYAPCFAQDKDRDAASAPAASPTACVVTSFTGNVKRAQPFVMPIGSGLTYRLAPFRQSATSPAEQPEFIGWTIEVAYLKQQGDMEREFSWVMTPPYRQWNARQLNTSYGKSIVDALKADHTVYFPLDILEYAEADKMVTRILWRSSPPEFQEAARELPRIPVGSAKLTLDSSQTRLGSLKPEESLPKSKVDYDNLTMEGLGFRVDLTIPVTVKLTPDLARRAKPAACPVSPLIPMLHEMAQ